MAGRDGANARARLVRLSDKPQLVVHTPAAASLSDADNLDGTVRHGFKVDLKVGFKVTNPATSRRIIARRPSPEGYVRHGFKVDLKA